MNKGKSGSLAGRTALVTISDRQYNIGAVRLAEKAAVECNVSVRILVPTSATKLVDTTFRNLTRGYLHKIGTRYIEQMSETKATILVVGPCGHIQ